MPLSKEAMIGFRDLLRESRESAIADAEGFQEIIFAIERIGTALLGRAAPMGSFEGKLRNFAEPSPLAFCIPSRYRFLFTPLDLLLKIVREARNDAVHQGAYARHMTSHLIELSLILEDALTMNCTKVSDFMVKSVVCAELWQPLAYLRQIMLSNSFSFLPVKLADGAWSLVSDLSLAKALQRTDNNRRNETLGLTLEKAIERQIINLEKANVVPPDEDINSLLATMGFQPVLVHHRDDKNEIIGIVTSFDLM